MNIETTKASALAHATKAANEFGLPQTIYKNADSCGWWHICFGSPLLRTAKEYMTVLPERYFQ